MEISQMLIEAPADAEIQLRKALAKNKLDTHPRIHCLPILMNRHSASAAEAALKKLGAVNFSESKQWTNTELNAITQNDRTTIEKGNFVCRSPDILNFQSYKNINDIENLLMDLHMEILFFAFIIFYFPGLYI